MEKYSRAWRKITDKKTNLKKKMPHLIKLEYNRLDKINKSH